ncbi:MAG TPA: serine/threonine-protein kinase, partial [Gemmataceae bacterium]|nr:serine/threonine-protein kinase [Gemmataceae bacterium]
MANVSACPDRESLVRILSGGSSPGEIEQVADHLLDCAACGTLFDSLLQNDSTVIALRNAPREVGPADGAIERLQSRLTRLRPAAAIAASGEETLGLSADSSRDAEQPASPTESTEAGLTFLNPGQQPDEIGRLGPYRILKKLGQGGMGMVFLAEDVLLQRKVALKTMLPQAAATAQSRERFFREARAAAAIEHAHIVVIHQVGEDNGVPYLAMALLRGQSLEERLAKEGKLLPAEAARIAVEMAEGLGAAHAEGLVHRDIKPGNVWLEGPSGQVKLLDFGLARAETDTTHLTQSGVILGTPAFMAPEQARNENVDSRADLFALGCVLYVMLTGKRPFTGNTLVGVLTSLAVDTPLPPHEVAPEVPRALSDITMRLLAKSPQDRPASAKAVAGQLRRIPGAAPPAEVAGV